jgi:CRISPR-associated protein Csc3
MENTLLQHLLIDTNPDVDPILRSYIETVLPAMEREFAFVYAMGGYEEDHYRRLLPRYGDELAREIARDRAKKPDQSLLVHVLNALLIAWKLNEFIPEHLKVKDDVEKRLLCLGITLHDYGKKLYDLGREIPRACEVPEILDVCQKFGEDLNFDQFWTDWRQYLPEISYLAQNTQFSVGANAVPANWEVNGQKFTHNDRRLNMPLRRLLAFGDVAVHLSDPADIVNVKPGNKKRSSGETLQEHIRHLKIPRKLVFHRLRDCRGLLTNGIHNILLHFSRQSGWEPILFFAQGVVYLAPTESESPDLAVLQEFIWEQLVKSLSDEVKQGKIGFKRDGKGLKVAPQALELFSPATLIRQLPDVVKINVANENAPATPKRLEKLPLDDSERKLLADAKATDIRSDRLAEFLILAQREFFEGREEYITWVLNTLGLQERITPEQTQVQSGGVNYGWYRVAAHYIASNSTWDKEQVVEEMSNLADQLATWAEENDFLEEVASPTSEDFFNYLAQYLEVSGWEHKPTQFQHELTAYTDVKISNQPICSLSSGEFAAEDQLDSVVLFKPQQYSNKNALGGGRIKRGISRIWSLEMLLRQARWSARGGKLEEQQPVFLYIYPAYVYSPETVKAIRYLVEKLDTSVNLWDVKNCWLRAEMHSSGLQNLPWCQSEEIDESVEATDKYSNRDLPFMATKYTKTLGKTTADAWVKPAFLALRLPILLGVKVVATASPDPLYASDKEFLESVKLDGPAGFWNLLGLDTSLRLQDLEKALKRLLITYSLHLDNRSSPRDARWQALNGTVRDLVTDVLNVFALANEGLRRNKHEPTKEDVQQYWKYAQIWAEGEPNMQEKLKITRKLVSEYRKFYQVGVNDSSHAILLPLSKALEEILSVPENWDDEELIFQGAGQLQAALDRQEVYKRPLIKDKSVPYETRQAQEFQAIHAFMTTCVKELFGQMCKGDHALLQENRNRIKSGAEFAYRWLALQEKQSQPEQTESNKSNK